MSEFGHRHREGQKLDQIGAMSDPGSFLLPHLRPEAPRLLLGAGALLAASFVNFRTGAQLRGAIESNAGHGLLLCWRTA